MREVRDIFAGGLRLRTAALVAAAVSPFDSIYVSRGC